MDFDAQAGGLSLFPNSLKLNRKRILQNSVVFFFFFPDCNISPKNGWFWQKYSPKVGLVFGKTDN